MFLSHYFLFPFLLASCQFITTNNSHSSDKVPQEDQTSAPTSENLSAIGPLNPPPNQLLATTHDTVLGYSSREDNMDNDPNFKKFVEAITSSDSTISGSQLSVVADFGPVPSTNLFAIRKSQFDKPYLLSMNVFEGAPAGLGQNLSNFLVFFRQQDNILYMFEDLTTSQQIASTNIPTQHLIAQFAVIQDNSDSLIFDFASEISQILNETRADHGAALDVSGTYINKIYLRNQTAFVDIAIQVRIASSGNNPITTGLSGTLPTRVQYSLTPYTQHPDFPIKEPIPNAGFFETDPVMEQVTGRQTTHITRWFPGKELHWSLSKNIPADYRQAVIDGLMYWQKLLGTTKIVIDDLPEGIGPHEPGYNVVQWIDWQQMSFAYSDYINDPVTGEMLQAQIYIPSSFVFSSLFEVEGVLAKMAEDSANVTAHTFRKHTTSLYCRGSTDASFKKALSQLLMQPNISSNVLKVYSQDLVRAVIAHEAGHTLGLKHNFAGSLITSSNSEKFDQILAYYFVSGNLSEDIQMSSSIMDYNDDNADVLHGARMRSGFGPLTYDVAAIGWGYNDFDWRQMEFGPYCTDTDIGTYLDCKQFDLAGSPIHSAYSEINRLKSDVTRNLLQIFQLAKAPLDPKDAMPLQEIPFSPATDADNGANLVANLLDLIRNDTNLVWLKKDFKFLTDFNQDLLKKSRLEYQKHDVASELVNFATLFAQWTPKINSDGTIIMPLVATMESNFITLQQNEHFKSGFSPVGKPYAFTTDELAYMNATGKKYFDLYDKALVMGIIQALSGVKHADSASTNLFNSGNSTPTPTPTPTQDSHFARINNAELSKAIASFATAVITANELGTKSGIVNGTLVTIPIPRYDHDTRVAAAALFGSTFYDLDTPTDLTLSDRNALIANLNQQLSTISNFDPSLAQSTDPSLGQSTDLAGILGLQSSTGATTPAFPESLAAIGQSLKDILSVLSVIN